MHEGSLIVSEARLWDFANYMCDAHHLRSVAYGYLPSRRAFAVQ